MRSVFLSLTITFLAFQPLFAQTAKIDSSVTVKIKNGSYILSGVVADAGSKNEIVEKVKTRFAAPVDSSGLKVVPGAAPFQPPGWQNDFEQSLLKLKRWKTGVFIFSTGTNREIQSLPKLLPADISNARIFLLDKPEPVRLADYRNRLVALIFLETWCYPCLVQGENLKKLKAQYPAALEVIGVSSETTSSKKEDLRKFADRQNFGFPLGWADKKLLEAASVVSRFQGIPQTFIIYNGQLRAVFLGDSPKVSAELKETVEKLLRENNL